MNRNRFYKIIAACIICLFLSSCGFKDIDKRIFVQAIGVDHSGNEEKPFKVTLKLAVPSGSLKEAGTSYTYLSREDSTLAGAIRFLKTHVDKELDFGHTKVLVFDHKILEKDIREALDFFIRRRDIQMISWVAIGDPSAEEVLKVEPKSEMAGSTVLTNLFSGNGVESSYIVSTFLFDTRRKIVESGIEPTIPIIRTNKDRSKLMVNQAYVFTPGKKPVKLTSKHTKIFNLMANRSNKLDIEVKKKDEEFTMSVESAKVKYKIITSPKKPPVLKMKIRVTGIVEESKFKMDPKDLNTYSRLTAQHTKKESLKFLKFLQEENVDPLGFGLRYKATRISNGKRINEWKEMYPNLVFDVTVDAKIRSTGTVE
ncbi:Ger(x)C family spore germination protein [Siminovitchia acidinfaciens]|uniref:Ger(X)C family spore germination protein n=1 Tax=Siminovitchia acidinfaciens TaxID=2321395 RepID=A0A429Y017_9BACI|nr:Ger(x)C family spore germination protein [Siminovitchia acidinfaciens]RST74319.1 Ger(x)C family spore germination protein [Siminovitchia acidinfaciens]